MSARAGFTLVELVAVVLILGMAAAIATPAILRERPHSDAERVALALADQLQRARVAALKSSRPVVVTIETETGQLRAERVESGRSTVLFQSRVELAPGVRIQSEERLVAVRFDPLGRGIGDDISVTLDSESVLVEVDPLTGRIEVVSADARRLQPA